MTNDKQRERLVELLKDVEYQYTKINSITTENVADWLLRHGVIVPLCKVGDTVYVIIENMPFVHAGVSECEVEWYSFGKDGLRPTVKVKSDNIIDGINLQVYLEDLYLTREEAEQALNNVQNGNSCEGGVQE